MLNDKTFKNIEGKKINKTRVTLLNLGKGLKLANY